uniref:Uncharacterized protein n=1 Tax=Romanomermis culicivorax TaxID=13658 RepID=A0A915JRM9_ROMCU
MCDDKSDTFSQTEEIEAEKSNQFPAPSPHHLPMWQMEVTELEELIFLMAQALATISPNCQ